MAPMASPVLTRYRHPLTRIAPRRQYQPDYARPLRIQFWVQPQKGHNVMIITV